MYTIGARQAQDEQSAEIRVRDDVRAVFKQPGIKSRLPDNGIRIKAEIAQARRDLLGKGEVDAAGGKRGVSPRYDGERDRYRLPSDDACHRPVVLIP